VIDQPTLRTKRLILRPFRSLDAADIQRLAGEREISSTTLHIPHPYEDGVAEQWLATHEKSFAEGLQAVFAIAQAQDNFLAGAIGLSLNRSHRHAEMGFWVGKPFWGRGYCTEAAREILRYGFEELDLHRIHAHYFTRNPASGRVMEKIGMKYEGCLRQHLVKWDQFEDIRMYGILKNEF